MTKPTDQEIEDRFAHHPPMNGAVDLHSQVRAIGAGFALWLNKNLPESRELTNALDALQATTMWANAAIAIHVSGAGPEEPCPNCGEMVSRVGLKPGEHPHRTFTEGLIGSGRWTCKRQPDPLWETRLRVERALRMQAEMPNEHVVVLSETGWTVLHADPCVRQEKTEDCLFTRAAAHTDFSRWPSPTYAVVVDGPKLAPKVV